MSLADALGVQPGDAVRSGPDVVTLVGAGGKTTALYHLAAELARRGWRVLVTTTTRIWPPDPGQVDGLFYASDEAEARRQLAARTAPGQRLLVAAGETAEGKLRGVSPDLVCRIRDLADVILVEADGARGRSLKAPAPYEPVIPPCATLLVPVAGLDVIGRPLSADWVHRPERVSTLTGLHPGDEVTSAAVARVLTHPEGGLKDAPPAVRVAVLLNKADDGHRLRFGREVAQRILSTGVAGRVVLGSVATAADAVRDVMIDGDGGR